MTAGMAVPPSTNSGDGQAWAFLGGRFVPQSEAHLTLHDAGFIWGATVTDLCRTFAHKPFRLRDHVARFRLSCLAARVSLRASDDDLIRTAEELVRRNASRLDPAADLALVMFATPGPVGYYLGEPGGPGDGEPTLGMHTFPLPLKRNARLYQEGARLIVPSVRHVPAVSVDPRIKQRSRLHWWLAEQQAHDVDPLASALLLNEHGHLTETAAANFLIFKDAKVLTPPRETVLNGVSLLTVEDLCRELGVLFEERPITVEDALSAGEAMLASTSYCLVGVASINGVAIPHPGPVWRRLIDRWSHHVLVDIPRQGN